MFVWVRGKETSNDSGVTKNTILVNNHFGHIPVYIVGFRVLKSKSKLVQPIVLMVGLIT